MTIGSVQTNVTDLKKLFTRQIQTFTNHRAICSRSCEQLFIKNPSGLCYVQTTHIPLSNCLAYASIKVAALKFYYAATHSNSKCTVHACSQMQKDLLVAQLVT